ncbi:MAG: hypothetical protein WA919_12440 [Coleofasciculaceae cyanobacterium]
MKFSVARISDKTKSTLGILFLVFLCFGCSEQITQADRCRQAELVAAKAQQEYDDTILKFSQGATAADAAKAVELAQTRQDAEDEAFEMCIQVN